MESKNIYSVRLYVDILSLKNQYFCFKVPNIEAGYKLILKFISHYTNVRVAYLSEHSAVDNRKLTWIKDATRIKQMRDTFGVTPKDSAVFIEKMIATTQLKANLNH